LAFHIPDNLKHLSRSQAGRDWLAELPDLISGAISHWALEDIGEPFAGSSVSYAVPAIYRNAGQTSAVVLKLQFPHPECLHEADALRIWDGDGAIRLIDTSPRHHALLLERCLSGRFLADAEDTDPIAVLSDLLPKLWRPAGAPFNTLASEAERWRKNMNRALASAEDAREEKLLRIALAQLAVLQDSSTEKVLLHQDLHGHNILASERQNWLAIDPKPVVGERAFSLSPIIRSSEFGFSRKDVLYRLDRLSEELEVDRERARGWTIVQTMAWGLEPPWKTKHQQIVEWLLPSQPSRM
jgi:streptomycin 6-kinase